VRIRRAAGTNDYLVSQSADPDFRPAGKSALRIHHQRPEGRSARTIRLRLHTCTYSRIDSCCLGADWSKASLSETKKGKGKEGQGEETNDRSIHAENIHQLEDTCKGAISLEGREGVDIEYVWLLYKPVRRTRASDEYIQIDFSPHANHFQRRLPHISSLTHGCMHLPAH